jgi:BsuBI/PstI restriction endonuclease
MAAKTVFAMLYIGAVEGNNRWLAPKHVYRLSNTQARMRTDAEREGFAANAMRPGFVPKKGRWYADNSRESIRDETLKEGLTALGAVTVRPGIATTSGQARYALRTDFAGLFDPEIQGTPLALRVVEWQNAHLSVEARTRLRIVRQGRTLRDDLVTITLPSRESRNMQAGPSSEITKQVVEAFAPRFLVNPAVVWISESGNKVVARDDALARDIGLDIRPERALPDVILADAAEPFLLVFVEVVATDGAINPSRREALLELARETKIDERHVIFVTAFLDRSESAFRRAVPNLGWGSIAWFAAEPENIMVLDGIAPRGVSKLRDLLKL